MRTFTFECEDAYEADKLASLMSVQKDGTMWVTGIAAVIKNEVVVQLKDKSSHAVIMKSVEEAEKLRGLLTEVSLGRAAIRTSASTGHTTVVSVD